MKNILKSNVVLIIFYLLYLIILYGIFKDSFIGILIIHLIFIFIALTPIGESIMRLLNHTKKIVLKEDREYLYSLFDEVYEQAKKKNPINIRAYLFSLSADEFSFFNLKLKNFFFFDVFSSIFASFSTLFKAQNLFLLAIIRNISRNFQTLQKALT